MAEVFDPYRDWLGLNFAEREYPLNHYQILGLDQNEKEPGAIQHAADRMLARVRGQRPGDRAADWGRVLDEIESARDCLSASDRRAAYDAGLVADNLKRVVTPDTTEKQEPETPSLDKGAWSPPEFDAAPAEPEDTTSESSATSPVANPPDISSPPPAPPSGAPPSGAPVEQVPMATPTDVPLPPAAIPLAAAGADPMAPVELPVAVPVGQATASAPVAASVTVHAESSTGGYNPVAPEIPGLAVAINIDDDQPDSSRSKMALIGIVAALLLWVAGMAAFFSGAFDSSDQPNAEITAKDKKPKTPAVTPDPDKPPKKRIPVVPTPRPKPEPKPQPEPTPQPAPIPDPLPSPDPVPPIPVPNPEPKPEPQPPAREQIVAFLGHLSSARKDLTRRDFKSAQRHLDDAGANVVPAELEAKRERLQALLDATNDFWKSMTEAMRSLRGGEEFKISESTIVRIIEVNRSQLIVRLGGQTLRYPVNSPPMGIARLLVAQWLSKDVPRTKIAIGASWATIPAADLDKARKYFRQAADAGVDTKALLQAIDDDYRAPPVGAGS